jgi:RNA polymerase sigma-70 factor (ECF subfamily)
MDATTHPMDIRRELVALLPQIRRFAVTLTRDSTKIDELVAAACEQAIHKSHLWKNEKRLEARVFSLVRSLVSTEQRKRQGGLPNSSVKAIQGADPHGHINVMSPVHAVVFLLCAVEGLTYAEASMVMDMTSEAIADAMVSARRELAAAAASVIERRA